VTSAAVCAMCAVAGFCAKTAAGKLAVSPADATNIWNGLLFMARSSMTRLRRAFTSCAGPSRMMPSGRALSKRGIAAITDSSLGSPRQPSKALPVHRCQRPTCALPFAMLGVKR
jgi:hypothetical protein